MHTKQHAHSRSLAQFPREVLDQLPPSYRLALGVDQHRDFEGQTSIPNNVQGGGEGPNGLVPGNSTSKPQTTIGTDGEEAPGSTHAQAERRRSGDSGANAQKQMNQAGIPSLTNVIASATDRSTRAAWFNINPRTVSTHGRGGSQRSLASETEDTDASDAAIQRQVLQQGRNPQYTIASHSTGSSVNMSRDNSVLAMAAETRSNVSGHRTHRSMGTSRASSHTDISSFSTSTNVLTSGLLRKKNGQHEEFKLIVRRYYYQLTVGCRNADCDFRLCKTASRGLIAPETAAILALEMASKHLKLQRQQQEQQQQTNGRNTTADTTRDPNSIRNNTQHTRTSSIASGKIPAALTLCPRLPANIPAPKISRGAHSASTVGLPHTNGNSDVYSRSLLNIASAGSSVSMRINKSNRSDPKPISLHQVPSQRIQRSTSAQTGLSNQPQEQPEQNENYTQEPVETSGESLEPSVDSSEQEDSTQIPYNPLRPRNAPATPTSTSIPSSSTTPTATGPTQPTNVAQRTISTNSNGTPVNHRASLPLRRVLASSVSMDSLTGVPSATRGEVLHQLHYQSSAGSADLSREGTRGTMSGSEGHVDNGSMRSVHSAYNQTHSRQSSKRSTSSIKSLSNSIPKNSQAPMEPPMLKPYIFSIFTQEPLLSLFFDLVDDEENIDTLPGAQGMINKNLKSYKSDPILNDTTNTTKQAANTGSNDTDATLQKQPASNKATGLYIETATHKESKANPNDIYQTDPTDITSSTLILSPVVNRYFKKRGSTDGNGSPSLVGSPSSENAVRDSNAKSSTRLSTQTDGNKAEAFLEVPLYNGSEQRRTMRRSHSDNFLYDRKITDNTIRMMTSGIDTNDNVINLDREDNEESTHDANQHLGDDKKNLVTKSSDDLNDEGHHHGYQHRHHHSYHVNRHDVEQLVKPGALSYLRRYIEALRLVQISIRDQLFSSGKKSRNKSENKDILDDSKSLESVLLSPDAPTPLSTEPEPIGHPDFNARHATLGLLPRSQSTSNLIGINSLSFSTRAKTVTNNARRQSKGDFMDYVVTPFIYTGSASSVNTKPSAISKLAAELSPVVSPTIGIKSPVAELMNSKLNSSEEDSLDAEDEESAVPSQVDSTVEIAASKENVPESATHDVPPTSPLDSFKEVLVAKMMTPVDGTIGGAVDYIPENPAQAEQPTEGIPEEPSMTKPEIESIISSLQNVPAPHELKYLNLEILESCIYTYEASGDSTFLVAVIKHVFSNRKVLSRSFLLRKLDPTVSNQQTSDDVEFTSFPVTLSGNKKNCTILHHGVDVIAVRKCMNRLLLLEPQYIFADALRDAVELLISTLSLNEATILNPKLVPSRINTDFKKVGDYGINLVSNNNSSKTESRNSTGSNQSVASDKGSGSSYHRKNKNGVQQSRPLEEYVSDLRVFIHLLEMPFIRIPSSSRSVLDTEKNAEDYQNGNTVSNFGSPVSTNRPSNNTFISMASTTRTTYYNGLDDEDEDGVHLDASLEKFLSMDLQHRFFSLLNLLKTNSRKLIEQWLLLIDDKNFDSLIMASNRWISGIPQAESSAAQEEKGNATIGCVKFLSILHSCHEIKFLLGLDIGSKIYRMFADDARVSKYIDFKREPLPLKLVNKKRMELSIAELSEIDELYIKMMANKFYVSNFDSLLPLKTEYIRWVKIHYEEKLRQEALKKYKREFKKYQEDLIQYKKNKQIYEEWKLLNNVDTPAEKDIALSVEQSQTSASLQLSQQKNPTPLRASSTSSSSFAEKVQDGIRQIPIVGRALPSKDSKRKSGSPMDNEESQGSPSSQTESPTLDVANGVTVPDSVPSTSPVGSTTIASPTPSATSSNIQPPPSATSTASSSKRGNIFKNILNKVKPKSLMLSSSSSSNSAPVSSTSPPAVQPIDASTEATFQHEVKISVIAPEEDTEQRPLSDSTTPIDMTTDIPIKLTTNEDSAASKASPQQPSDPGPEPTPPQKVDPTSHKRGASAASIGNIPVYDPSIHSEDNSGSGSQPIGVQSFSFLNFPFLLSPSIKMAVIHRDAIIQMTVGYENAFVNQSLVLHSQRFMGINGASPSQQSASLSPDAPHLTGINAPLPPEANTLNVHGTPQQTPASTVTDTAVALGYSIQSPRSAATLSPHSSTYVTRGGRSGSPNSFADEEFLNAGPMSGNTIEDDPESGVSTTTTAVMSAASPDAPENSGSETMDRFETTMNRIGATNPFLVLEIRREQLVDDVLAQLSVYAKRGMKEMKKPLKIKFVNEQGQDQGGVQKEFFQVLIDRLIDPDYGMFTYNNETRTSHINGFTLVAESKFELIGYILGLALYNGIIIGVKLPNYFYKILLGEELYLSDLQASFPSLGKGLQQLLDWDDPTCDVSDIFMRSFEISYEIHGQVKHYPLIRNGADILVTNETREQYVRLYIDHFLYKSKEIQFNAICRGFWNVVGDTTKKLCRYWELEWLLCGNEMQNTDFKELETGCEYDANYTRDSPIINWFWELVHDEMDIATKKKLLNFVTASDRVPLGGLSKLNFIIQRNGPDSERLPTALTCFGRLLLPEYESKDKLRKFLLLAVKECKGFGLI